MTYEEFLKVFPTFAKSYQPSEDVIKHLSKVSLLMIVGPSGVGKSTMIQRSGIHFVPSDTTRSPRPGEKNGVDFHFRTDLVKVIEEMKTGNFVQVAIGSGGDFYATRASSFTASGWATMPIVSDVIPIFRNLGFAKTVTAFVTPPSYTEWMRRLETHIDSRTQKTKRLAEALQSYKFALKDPETHIVINDSIEAAVHQLKDLLEGNADKDREAEGRLAVEKILEKLK